MHSRERTLDPGSRSRRNPRLEVPSQHDYVEFFTELHGLIEAGWFYNVDTRLAAEYMLQCWREGDVQIGDVA